MSVLTFVLMREDESLRKKSASARQMTVKKA
jgi:hypothetical protein